MVFPAQMTELLLLAVATGLAFTVTVIVVDVASCPAFGVKVKVVVTVLFNAGDQVPDMSLFEVVGKAANVAPLQMGAMAAKVGRKVREITTV